jgi:hypothetical protein
MLESTPRASSDRESPRDPGVSTGVSRAPGRARTQEPVLLEATTAIQQRAPFMARSRAMHSVSLDMWSPFGAARGAGSRACGPKVHRRTGGSRGAHPVH